MLKISTTLALCLALSGTALAQTPPEVLSAYKAYNNAVAEKDYKAAMKHGKAAWKAAESTLGDNKTTGDLAFNYGFLVKTRGKPKDAISALERAVELSTVGHERGNEIKLERSVELISAYEVSGDVKKVKKFASNTLNFAKSVGLDKSVFAGEILVHRAQDCSRIANRAAGKVVAENRSKVSSRLDANNSRDKYTAKIQKKCGRDAQDASNIFAANPKMSRPRYVALAANQVGFMHERENDWLKAAMSYQTARQAVEDIYGRDNDFVMQIVGRWLHARNQIAFKDKLDNAKAAGLCDCWPINANTDKVALVKSVSADMPRRVLEVRSSGFVILEADVTDAGATENIRVVHSWPANQYDENAIKAFSQYQYAPKSGSEWEGYRKGIVADFSFTVYNEDTQETY